MPSYDPFSALTIGTRSNALADPLRIRMAASAASKPDERGADHLIGALGDGRVAGLDLDAVRRRGLDVARDDEDRRQRVTEIRRTEREERDRRRGDRAGDPDVALHRLALDALALLDLVHALDRVFDQAADQLRRPVAGPLGRFHRAEDRRIERRLVLFEIQRDLFVGDLARQRPREEPRAGGDEDQRR